MSALRKFTHFCRFVAWFGRIFPRRLLNVIPCLGRDAAHFLPRMPRFFARFTYVSKLYAEKSNHALAFLKIVRYIWTLKGKLKT